MLNSEISGLILQTGDIQSLPFWNDKSWKHYPFAYEGTEENYTLPAAEGWRPGNESQSWTIEGHLIAEGSGKRYAFICIYNYNVMGRLLGFHWRLFQVTDLSEKKCYTDRRYHFRPFPDLFKPPLDIKQGKLDISYKPKGGPDDRWYIKTDSSGNLIPFEYRLEASGVDRSGDRTNLAVDLEALKPPMILGAWDYLGKITMMGQPDTFSLSFPRIKIKGTLDLAGKVEQVEGIGWAGLQWAPKHFGKKNHPLRRIKHEIYFVQLSNGWDFNFWRQYDTFRCNRVMPFSGISAVLEDNTMATTNNYSLEAISYYRNPRRARPLLRTAPKVHYYAHSSRLTIPEWDADLVISPILDDNTIGLFVEYLIGSTEITGKIRGQKVHGVGLTEHTKIWYENYEMVQMIQRALIHLPEQAFIGDREITQRKLINDLEEVLAAIEVGDKSRARTMLRTNMRIIAETLREEELKGATASPSMLCGDLLNRL